MCIQYNCFMLCANESRSSKCCCRTVDIHYCRSVVCHWARRASVWSLLHEEVNTDAPNSSRIKATVSYIFRITEIFFKYCCNVYCYVHRGPTYIHQYKYCWWGHYCRAVPLLVTVSHYYMCWFVSYCSSVLIFHFCDVCYRKIKMIIHIIMIVILIITRFVKRRSVRRFRGAI